MSDNSSNLILYTIGYSTHPLEAFIALLLQHHIDAIADVRSTPFSRFKPEYDRDSLSRCLKDHGIRYVFLGEELGARRTEAECYVDNKVRYSRVAQMPMFRKGIDRLKDGAKKMRVAIMCAERDPITCHRTILVAREARSDFQSIFHILADGSLETQEHAEERLLAAYAAAESDMFQTKQCQLDDAYERRAEEIAYEERSNQQNAK